MITLDATELMKLNSGFERYGHILPKSVVNKALKDAAQPMLRSARSLSPVGSKIAYTTKGGTDQDRGGATRRDVRLRIVKSEGEEISRLLIGVSQKSGKVGWRTHFITTGYTDPSGGWHRGRDFLNEAYDNTIEIVRNSFYKTLFEGVVKWGKQNLPQ